VESFRESRSSEGDDFRRVLARQARSPFGWWLALLGLFTVVALSVDLGWWSGLDQSVNDWASPRWRSWLWDTSQGVFDVTAPEIALPVAVACGVLAAWRRHQWQIVGETVFRVALVVGSVLLLKPLLAVPGPTRDPLGDHGGAFPSGHTTSTLVCVMLFLIWLGWPRSMVSRVTITAVAVGIVAVSVIYLNYHYVSDVIGGVLLGLLIVTVPFPVLRRGGTE
jgi:membrane-associated phospholipid phosphatase